MMRAYISGTGAYLPERVVTNHDLSLLMDTSDEWICQRSGIKERRFAADHETPSDLALNACREALQNANQTIQDIDLIIVATLTPEHCFPGTGSFLQSKLLAKDTPVLEVRNQCTGFIYSLATAQAFIQSGLYKKILVCGVEIHSRALDFSNRGRDTAVLFGDGAGAVILEATPDPERGILACTLKAEGQHADKLWVEYPTTRSKPHMPASAIEDGSIYPKMDGKTVFKHAVTRLPEVVGESLSKLHLRPADIDLFVFHQANLRINEKVALDLGLRPDQVFNNIAKYGNCSAASIPIAFHEARMLGKIKNNSLVGLAGFGSGFAWGSMIIRM